MLPAQSNNNRLAGYIDKVRQLQTDNKRITKRIVTVEEEQVGEEEEKEEGEEKGENEEEEEKEEEKEEEEEEK